MGDGAKVLAAGVIRGVDGYRDIRAVGMQIAWWDKGKGEKNLLPSFYLE